MSTVHKSYTIQEILNGWCVMRDDLPANEDGSKRVMNTTQTAGEALKYVRETDAQEMKIADEKKAHLMIISRINWITTTKLGTQIVSVLTGASC